MQAITTKIWEDTNGDGIHDRNDIHGYSVFLGLNTTDVWLAAFDLDLIDVHDDGTFEITFFNEKTVGALEKAIALSYDENGSFINKKDWRDVPKAFSEAKNCHDSALFRRNNGISRKHGGKIRILSASEV